MLKLKMNPRKRQKRTRSLPSPPRSPWPLRQDRLSQVAQAIKEQKETFGDHVLAMLKQEESAKYNCVDYLSMTAWQNNVGSMLMSGKRGAKRSHTASESRIDEYCREQICEWSYRVVDYFRIDREVVSLSLSYLDRFLCTCSCDRTMFKLAATTTLYMSVKLVHPQKLGDLGVLSDLSRGEFDMNDVADMEGHILHALSWLLHPPTAVAMSSILLDYVFCDGKLDISNADTEDLYDNVSFFGELAVCDYFFVKQRPSTVALASILNALEGMYGADNEVASQLLQGMANIPFPTDRQEIAATRNRLWELYERSEECALHNDVKAEEEKHAVVYGGSVTKKGSSVSLSSPVSVAKPCKTTDFFPARAKTLQNGSW